MRITTPWISNSARGSNKELVKGHMSLDSSAATRGALLGFQSQGFFKKKYLPLEATSKSKLAARVCVN